MVVDVELEADAVEQAVEGLRLGLGRRGRAPVRLAGEVGRRALVVVAPLGLVVAVGVDTVGIGDDPVAVVVAQVLAPQALAGLEREVVAVGVGDGHEPQLGAVHQVRDGGVAAVAVDDVVGQPPVHLGRDPLTGMLGRREQRGRAATVAGAVGPPRDLDGDDVLPVHRLADRDQLDDVGVVGRELLVLLLEPAGAAVGSEDLVARSRLAGGQLGDRLAVDLLELEVDALLDQVGGLIVAEDDLDVGLAVGGGRQVHLVHVETGRPHGREVARGRAGRRRRRWCRRPLPGRSAPWAWRRRTSPPDH